MNPARLALIIAVLLLNATCSLECTRCDLYTAGNQPACCLTFTPPKQVVVWYGTQTGGGTQQTAGGVISNVGASGQAGASRPGNLQQTPQMIPSGYQQGVQGSNSPTYLSPQQQQQGTGTSAPTPIRNPQTGNFVQGQGASAQISPGGLQYQPMNQGNGGYNGANTGFQTVTITGYSQTGGGFRPTTNQASNPSTFPSSQGGSQQAWNTQSYNAASSAYTPNQPGNVNAGGQNQGSYFPQQPQRDDQINSMGQSRPYQVTENYGESQRLAGSSSNGRMPTTASPPFTQAPYSPSNVPNQGVFPTAPINVYTGEMSTTSAGTQGYQTGSSGMPYTSTPFPYGATQNPNQGLSSQGAVNPNQVPYGASTGTFQGIQPGSSTGAGQFTPVPYQTSGTQSTSGFTSSSQQYTNQYDPTRTQTTMYGSTSPTQSPPSNYQPNNPQSQPPPGFTSSSQQPSYNYQTSGPQGQPQTSPAGFATSSPQPSNNYQTGGPQGPPLDSSAGFSSSTQQAPYGYQTSTPSSQAQPYSNGFSPSTPPSYEAGGAQGQVPGFTSSTQPSYATTEQVANGLYGQNAFGDFVHPAAQPQQRQYSAGQPGTPGGSQYDLNGAANVQYGGHDNNLGSAQLYDAPYSSAPTTKAGILSTILAVTLTYLVL